MGTDTPRTSITPEQQTASTLPLGKVTPGDAKPVKEAVPAQQQMGDAPSKPNAETPKPGMA